MRSGDGAQAYPNNAGSSEGFGTRCRRAALTLAISLVIFTLLRNVLFTDYKAETTDYLVKTGRADAVDRIIPKTAAEKRKEAEFAKLTLEQKVFSLMLTIESMHKEIEYLQDAFQNYTGIPVPRSPPQNTTLMHNTTTNTAAAGSSKRANSKKKVDTELDDFT